MKTIHHHTHNVHAHEVGDQVVVDSATVLRAGGFRVTRGRLALLSLLETVGTPLSIQEVLTRWPGQKPDTATVYRSLTDLHTAGIVRRVELGTGSAHFEYTPSRPHHHHIICNGCGVVEELDQCSLAGLEEKVMVTSEQFKSIYSHTLEFFGQCTTCSLQK
jgi:Fe2+ or Zn2+ uptake regulation protein